MAVAKSLLLVEDDELTRTALTRLLREEGYAVRWAADGHEALECLRGGPLPDCILLDLRMPRMDGQLFLIRQQQHPSWSAVPVVLVSGDAKVGEAAALLGAADYVRKPVEPETLLRTVGRLIARPGRGVGP
jgi:CheY-like chemotaxis protein